MPCYSTLGTAFRRLGEDLRAFGEEFHGANWQAVNVKNDPSAKMIELVQVSFYSLLTSRELDYYQGDIKPNLPWADDHFIKERIGGEPLNPGTTWKYWVRSESAKNHLRVGGKQFSHTYAERFWPKHAGRFNPSGGNLPPPHLRGRANHGVRYGYGDLDDLLNLFKRDLTTRQGYLPIWFPEDTGNVPDERTPCTLGYHFMFRETYGSTSESPIYQLQMFYPIRSCDYANHFRDDMYLAVRLALWLLNELGLEEDQVPSIRFGMWIGSLHCFINDFRDLLKVSTQERKS